MDAPDNAPVTSNRWVEDRLRALDPPDTWEPATNIALARFRERAAANAAPGWGARLRLRLTRGRAPAWIAAGVFACLLLLLTPVPRAVAQHVWNVFFAERVELVTLDVDKLPRSLTDQRISQKGPLDVRVASLRAAAELAHFTPRLPDPSVVGDGEPMFVVAGTISLESRVDTADLEAAARDAGLSDLRFPAHWNGARLGLHVSPIVTADYPRFKLLQVMPLAITAPPDFDLAAFTQNVLRIGGLSPSAARTFSAQMAAAPFALIGVSLDEELRMRQVPLRTGKGTLLHDINEDGSLQRTTLFWSTPDRLYAISSNLSDDEVIAIANAIR